MKKWILLVLLFEAGVAHAETTGMGEIPTPEERPPECGTMAAVSEGFGDAFLEFGMLFFGIFTRIVPDAGFAFDFTSGSGWAQISWPLAVAFGPETGREVLPRRCSQDIVLKANGSRLLLEPMVRIGSANERLAARFHLRPGYRFLYRESESKVGFGAGVGSTFDFAGGFEPSLSPEAVVSFGECCSPSYFTVAARYDRYFASARDVATLQLGWTFH